MTDVALNEKTYVIPNDGQVVIRQWKNWGAEHEIVLDRAAALTLAHWLEGYALEQFAQLQGTGE